jgi:hypothetical protein
MLSRNSRRLHKGNETESPESEPTWHSRRNFLAKLTLGTLGVAAAAGAFAPLLGLLQGDKSKTSDASQEFPGPDSIFHPASDPRLDPRRK